MKRDSSGTSDKYRKSMEFTDKEKLEPCKIARTKEVCNPSMVDGKSRKSTISAALNEAPSAGLPLAPKLVNEVVQKTSHKSTERWVWEMSVAHCMIANNVSLLVETAITSR